VPSRVLLVFIISVFFINIAEKPCAARAGIVVCLISAFRIEGKVSLTARLGASWAEFVREVIVILKRRIIEMARVR